MHLEKITAAVDSIHEEKLATVMENFSRQQMILHARGSNTMYFN
jgi:hypothetical protein